FYRQVAPLRGPLLGGLGALASKKDTTPKQESNDPKSGPDPAIFGHHPNGRAVDPASLCVQAPSVVEIRLPAELAAGCELATTATLDKKTGAEGSVQVEVVAGKPTLAAGLQRGEA